MNQQGFKEEIRFKSWILRINWSAVLSYKNPSASACSLFTEKKTISLRLLTGWLQWKWPCEHSVAPLPSQVRRSSLRWWRSLLEGRCGWSPGWAAVSGRTVWRQKPEIWFGITDKEQIVLGLNCTFISCSLHKNRLSLFLFSSRV